MQVGLTPYHAWMVAGNTDYNKNGKIELKELKFRHGAKQLVDTDRNFRVTTEELAHSLMRGDIFIQDRKAYPSYGYRPRPGGLPGFGRPGYGPPAPYYPPFNRQPPMPTAPGYPYTSPQAGSIGRSIATTAVSGGIGAGIGYMMKGPAGVAAGAAIGAAVGIISSLAFDN